MELKKVIENLEIKSDISNLSSQELKDKYCSTKEEYEKFLKVLSRVFVGRKLYPILVSNMYDKIISLISFARKSGVNNDVVDSLAYETAILEEIEYHQKQTIFDIHGEDYCQAHALFEGIIGSTNTKKDPSRFADKMKGMHECALIVQSDDKLSATEFGKVMGTLKALNLPEEQHNAWLDAYYKEHPKAQLCCNLNFLYLANYILRSHPSSCTDEFIELVKSVSSISIMSYKEIAKEDFSIEDYKKAFKTVNKNINKLENQREKENRPKRKIKDFFDKKRPN